jgi:putative flippase GtrA
MKSDMKEIFRYSLNGLIATSLHYLVLYSCVEILNFKLVGLANFCASLVGILFSFLGNKFFVFKKNNSNITMQFAKFSSLYILVAFFHGGFLYFWSDILQENYNYGFLIALIMQFVMGYLISKRLIFGNSIEINED